MLYELSEVLLYRRKVSIDRLVAQRKTHIAEKVTKELCPNTYTSRMAAKRETKCIEDDGYYRMYLRKQRHVVRHVIQRSNLGSEKENLVARTGKMKTKRPPGVTHAPEVPHPLYTPFTSSSSICQMTSCLAQLTGRWWDPQQCPEWHRRLLPFCVFHPDQTWTSHSFSTSVQDQVVESNRGQRLLADAWFLVSSLSGQELSPSSMRMR